MSVTQVTIVNSATDIDGMTIDGTINSIKGSSGQDTVILGSGGSLSVSSVETIVGSTDADAITLLNAGTVSISRIETITGSAGTNQVNLLSPLTGQPDHRPDRNSRWHHRHR